MANNTTLYGFKPYKSRLGGAFEMDSIILGGTVAAGDTLRRSSGVGVITAATGGDLVIGVAAQSGVSGETITYFPADSQTVFKCRIATGTVYDNTSHDGGLYGIAGTTGVQGIDLADTTNEEFRIISMAPTGTEEAASAEVIGVFVQSERGQPFIVNS